MAGSIPAGGIIFAVGACTSQMASPDGMCNERGAEGRQLEEEEHAAADRVRMDPSRVW